MTRLFQTRFYQHCPDCRQRMKRVVTEGTDIYNVELGYECPSLIANMMVPLEAGDRQ